MGRFYGRGQCPERRCLPLSEWPQADQRLWKASLIRGDLLDDGGIRAKYRAISNRKAERGNGRFLTFLQRRGLLHECEPGDRITPPVVVAYVDELKDLGNSGYTILTRLQELHDAAKVMDPCRDWSWIRRIASRVRVNARPARNKAAKIVSSMDLLDLGIALMRRAASESTLRLAALMFRDGLLIALIALRPLRRKNLASMTLGQHVVKRGGDWWLSFAGDEMKNDDPLEMPWQDELSTQLETWLSKWRSVLCQRRGRWAKTIGGALWVSAHGSPLSQDGLYGRFVIHTKRAFGHAINPHAARAIAATTLADVDPEHVRIAATLLGHRTFATTERYYLHGQKLQATRRYQEALLRRRRRGKG
jgi:integrase/recombinase XerD